LCRHRTAKVPEELVNFPLRNNEANRAKIKEMSIFMKGALVNFQGDYSLDPEKTPPQSSKVITVGFLTHHNESDRPRTKLAMTSKKAGS
jgi:hypothetical protein